MSKETTILFLGAGDIADLHADAIAHCHQCRLVGLWDIDRERTIHKAQLYNCRAYESADAALAAENVDAVFILTPLETHFTYASQSLRAGKHVLVEKPVATNIDQLVELKTLAHRHGQTLMPGHNYIHDEGIARSKRLLESGRLGKLSQLYILYNIHHPEEVARRYPGVIRQILTHHCYLLLYLAGQPESLMAMKAVQHYLDYDQEDVAMVNIRLCSGALAHFSANFAADDHSSDAWTFQVKLLGTEGSTRFSYNDWVINRPAAVHSHTYAAYHDHIHSEVRFFVEQCLGHGIDPPSTIDDAITCQHMIETIERSIVERREISMPSLP